MHTSALLLVELGGVLLFLGLLARVARRAGLSPIPLYLLGGLALGEGGILPIVTSESFIETGANLGVILLLLMLGLEYSGRELLGAMRSTSRSGFADLALNFTPGFVAGLLLGLAPAHALFLGGVTYISSSAVIAKLLDDLDWLANRETPVVLSILVFEDLAMAVILPVLGIIAIGGSLTGAAASVAIALALVVAILFVAARHGDAISRVAFAGSDEINLLTILGVTLLVGGIAEQLNVSAAVGAFLVGIGVSGEAAHRARSLLAPVRDLFAAVFFVFFGLITDPAQLPAVIVPVAILAVLTAGTKVATGWWAARSAGVGGRGRRRAGVALIARGEFSIVIAGLAVAAGAGQTLAALAAGYVLVMATLGPVAARIVDVRRAERRSV
jgi:CPA2 family monovalent cation:H+ antiporter-2